MTAKQFKMRNMITLILILGAAVFVLLKWQGCAKRTRGELSEPIIKGMIIQSVYGIGTVTANKTFQFKAGVTNTIHNLFVQEGDLVKQASPLLELDGGQIIKAPFEGTITALPVKVGENIFAQSIILELVDLSDRYLLVSLEQRGALQVRRGQTAYLSFDGMREQSFEGKVDSVYSNNNDFFVRIGIPTLPPQILPGMTADTAIGIKEKSDALLIPVAAIDQGKVTVVQNGRKRTVAVQTGIVDGAMAEVVGGELREGDRLLMHKRIAP